MDVGGTGVDIPVGDGIKTGVAVCRLEAAVGDAIADAVVVSAPEADVPVGDGIGGKVAVSPFEAEVPVGDGIGSAVEVNALEVDVFVGGGIGGAVIVDALDVDVSVGDAIGAANVGVTDLVSVGVRVPACGAFAGVQTSKQINISKRMIATINLNRS